MTKSSTNRTSKKSVPPALAVLSGKEHKSSGGLIRDVLHTPITSVDIQALQLINRVRPKPLRAYDQIPMKEQDLLRQVKLIAPYLSGKSVAFVGDNDCTSILLGLLTRYTHVRPARMLLVDFDERLLEVACNVAFHYGFADILEAQRYNVFDVLPGEVVGRYDWFYTNPPYGSRNGGESGRLFITRGCELTRSGGSGCIILPYDHERAWAGCAMLNTQRFLSDNGWVMRTMIDQLHQYYLDDDKQLTSSMMIVDNVEKPVNGSRPSRMPYAGRSVGPDEIPMFYGRRVVPPFARYIRRNGKPDYDWSTGETISK